MVFKRTFRLPVEKCTAYDRKLILNFSAQDAWYPRTNPKGDVKFFSPNTPMIEVMAWENGEDIEKYKKKIATRNSAGFARVNDRPPAPDLTHPADDHDMDEF
jgi:hypothetical protein